jgi:hypothetical protein
VTVDRDFFLSYTGADWPWAEWLLAELDAAGYSSVSRYGEFVAGGNIPLDMAGRPTEQTDSEGAVAPGTAGTLRATEWRSVWPATRLVGSGRWCGWNPCQPEGLLGPVLHIDVVCLDEAGARARLGEELAATVLGERRRPTDVAPTSSASSSVTDRPSPSGSPRALAEPPGHHDGIPLSQGVGQVLGLALVAVPRDVSHR